MVLGKVTYLLPFAFVFIWSAARADTNLTVSKFGDDVVLSWTGTGTSYDGTRSTTAAFFSSALMFSDFTGTSFVYTKATTNHRRIEFFDVTDEADKAENHGTDGAGFLPPMPPEVSGIATTTVSGQFATVTGTGFSDNPLDNVVCLSGGACVAADTSSPTQLDFRVPIGATSGHLTVTVGSQQANPAPVKVLLEDPSSIPIYPTYSLSYSRASGEFWSASLGGVLTRHYALGLGWSREEVDPGQQHTCGTKTDRLGRLYCAWPKNNGGLLAIRNLQTSPVGSAQSCALLACEPTQGPLPGCYAEAVAVDPNPEGLPSRDVFYLLWTYDPSGPGLVSKSIKKFSLSCELLDDDFGGLSTFWPISTSSSPSGMAVDPATGESYVADHQGQIVRFSLNGQHTVVRSLGEAASSVDVWHEPGTDFGMLLVTLAMSRKTALLPLDAVGEPLIIVKDGTNELTRPYACFGGTSLHETILHPDDEVLVIATHGGQTIERMPLPLLVAEPYDDGNPAEVWISSPDPNDRPEYQSHTRRSLNPSPSDSSTLRVIAYWRDGIAREVCATLGDDRSMAQYETYSSAVGCTKPYRDPVSGTINGLCDNHEPSAVAGVGSLVDTGQLSGCKTCAGRSSPCVFEFRVTKRFAGDNYRVHFYQQGSSWTLKSARAMAIKRVYVEQDRMCREGGILWDDPNREPDEQAGDGVVLIAKKAIRVDDLTQGDVIDIFDASRPFEGPHDVACARAIDASDPDFVVVTLSVVGAGGCIAQPYSLQYSYDASGWDFLDGKSAGVCVQGAGFYTADLSTANKRGDKTGPFDDAFTKIRVDKRGSGVIPKVPFDFFNDETNIIPMLRYSQVWFDQRFVDACDQTQGCYVPPLDCLTCCNLSQNVYHVMGTSGNPGDAIGLACSGSDTSLVYNPSVLDICGANATCEANLTRSVSSHELAHQFDVNPLEPPCGGHDAGAPATGNDAWCGVPGGTCVAAGKPHTACLMSRATDAPDYYDQLEDDVSRLECEDLAGFLCPPAVSTSCGGVGVRNQVDPR